jgi:tRNA pseudouridine synthase 2
MAAAATAAPPPAIATALSTLLRRGTNRNQSLRSTHRRCIYTDVVAEPAPAPAQLPSRRGGHAGTRLEEAVPAGEGRSRVDAWISARLGGGGVSRARVQASIRAGLVAVNGRPISKVFAFLPRRFFLSPLHNSDTKFLEHFTPISS